MAVEVKRGEVYLVELDATRGSEIRKTRPALIVSPDEMNRYLRSLIVAPMTTQVRPYASRVNCRFQNKHGQVALDQIRTVDRERLSRRLGVLGEVQMSGVLARLVEMFTV